jgi:hypothetical protein
VLDAVLKEVLSVILLLVKSDDPRNAKLLKYFNILFGVVTIALVGVSLLNGSHEGHKLAGNDPVDITIFNALIKLILLHVERAEVVPLELDRVLQTLQALEHRALVETVALASISIRFEKTVVGSEHVPCLLGGALQNDYHESTHQECAIDHLVSLVGGTVVKDTIVGVVLVAQQPSQLARIPMDHCQVQGTEIFVEREVRQIIVDIEEECILVILRWLCARYPIQFVYKTDSIRLCSKRFEVGVL